MRPYLNKKRLGIPIYQTHLIIVNTIFKEKKKKEILSRGVLS
ncbi:MAG: hypothetical protein BAJALOKI3v1_320035 [Promethearchaeota archaeon]|nr:MAG: hypothetical protein BAJALOKI3v1_320035 [Candidatus Lokiarchaeota archaeon]